MPTKISVRELKELVRSIIREQRRPVSELMHDSEEYKKDVAKNIYLQLGAGRLMVMTGAKNFISGGNYLSFKLPRGAKNGISYVKITLNGSDTYDMEFGKIRGDNYKVIDTKTGVYAEDLEKVFNEVTGLRTRM